MTDSCRRRKLSFCKLKCNNVNIILSLTLRYGMASDIGYTVDENQTGALLFLLVYDHKLYNDLVPYREKSTIITVV